jgi:hypothetical protein
MNKEAPIRPRSVKKQFRCALCGSIQDVELHHVGGQNHIAWFTVPLCKKHHDRITAALRQAGVEMRFTPDRQERLSRVRMATLVFLWMLEEIARKAEQL